jgi:ribosome biogenesis GTPase
MSTGTPGLVTSVGSRSCEVFLEGRGTVRCTLRGTLWDPEGDETRPVAVGDRVTVALQGGASEDGVIEDVAERKNRLARPQAGRRRELQRLQVIAANIDRLVVVAAIADPPFRAGLVDRFLVAAAMQDIAPLIVLNKSDLAAAAGVDPEALARPYRDFGYDVLVASCTRGDGIDALRRTMSAGVSLLVGHSGVGKTSLLNAVSPNLLQQTGAVTDYHGRGRHTTTRVCLLPLERGGWVVDSPGIREFGLEAIAPGDLARLYPGFGELPDQCRFSDCRHKNEPGCAVRAAVASGALPAERHDAYLRLLEDTGG